MKSRYCYCPMTSRRIGHRMTILERLRRRLAVRRMSKADLFQVTGYEQPIYPTKKTPERGLGSGWEL